MQYFSASHLMNQFDKLQHIVVNIQTDTSVALQRVTKGHHIIVEHRVGGMENQYWRSSRPPLLLSGLVLPDRPAG